MSQNSQANKEIAIKAFNVTEEEYNELIILGDKIGSLSALIFDPVFKEGAENISDELLQKMVMNLMQIFAATGDQKINVFIVMINAIGLALHKMSTEEGILSSNDLDNDLNPKRNQS